MILLCQRRLNWLIKKLDTLARNWISRSLTTPIINDSYLNNSKFYLNAKGSAILAVHFINFFKGGNVSTLPWKRRYEDFQRSAIQKLGELLKIIVPPDKNTHRRKH